MSGPQRHGARRCAAACCFVLLVLAFALVRGSAASAHGGNAQHPHPQHPATGGLLGGLGTVVSKLGNGVDGLLTGVGAVLGDRPHARPTSPAGTTTATRTTKPPSAPGTSAPDPQPPTSASSTSTATATSPDSAPGTAAHSSAAAVRSVRAVSHRTSPASPVAAASPGTRGPSPSRSTHVATALDSPSIDLPGIDITASLAALMIAMLLAVGLVVHRAGHRGERVR